VYAAHYDVMRRRCRAQLLGPAPGPGPESFFFNPQYVSELHILLLLMTIPASSGIGGYFLDLKSGVACTTEQSQSHPRARQAWEAFNRLPARSTGLVWSDQTEIAVSDPPGTVCHYVLDEKTGTIAVTRNGAKQAFTPTTDGKPLLRHASIWEAQAVRGVLALRGQLSDGSMRLMLFRADDGSTLREHLVKKKQGRFLLSHDGRWLAMERAPRLLVEKIDAPGEGLVTRCGGHSGEGRLYLGDRSFLIVMGQGATHRHLIRWSGDAVEFQYEHKKLGQEGFHTLGFEEVRPGVRPASAQLGLVLGTAYCDPQRFLVVGHREALSFALDRFGQLAVFGLSGTLLCMFMAFRDRLAAWLPDGSRCGSESLSLGPETSGARATLAQVLRGAGGTLTFTSGHNHGGPDVEVRA
jgi:hypothetical protein